MRVRTLLLLCSPALLPAQPQTTVGQFCLPCHSAAKHIGDLDLESASDLRRHPRVWQKVLEQLALGEMPPKAMPQPSTEQKTALTQHIRAELRQAGLAQAGDPGPVLLRRLNNAEYTNTIRDLTGVPTLDPAREFPIDGAAGEGFTNTGQSLVMSPALVTKYLDAAKDVARHAVLGPDGIRFSAFTTARDHTNETLAEIRAFYGRFTESGGVDNVTQQGVALDKNRGGLIPLEQYLKPGAKVASPRYLASLQTLLRATTPSLVLDPIRQHWRTSDTAKTVKAIKAWQETLWKFSTVGHIGKQDGPKSWLEPVSPLIAAQEFRVKLDPVPDQNELTIHLAAHDAGHGGSIIWKAPRLLIPGRDPLSTNGLDYVLERRQAILTNTAQSLANTNPDPAWRNLLALNSTEEPKITPITQRIEKQGDFDFIKGWGGGKQPTLLINTTAQAVRVPGQMKPFAVAALPTGSLQAVIGWRSPDTEKVKLEVLITPAHAECGNGILWQLDLRRGPLLRLRLADGQRRGSVTLNDLPLRAGDLLTLTLDARDGNASCDLTDLEWRITADDRVWQLKNITTGALDNWRFFAEPSATPVKPIPVGSLFARWFLAGDSEKPALAQQLQGLLTGPAPAAATPDGDLHRLFHSLAGPLLANLLPPTALGDLTTQAPAVHEIKLPASLVAGTEFAVTGAPANANSAAQLEVSLKKPTLQKGLRASSANVATKDGVWTGNNQTVAVALPVIATPGSPLWQRYEKEFDEFRRWFPASLCYTKIVPVDEVVTMTLFHREDDHLARLMLSPAGKQHLDLLWDRLMFSSRAPLLSVDAFEQLYQFATQDADPSMFEPLRQPILQRAAAFRKQLAAAEPKQLDSVLAFANRAYRRPLTGKEKDGLRTLYASLRQKEIPHDEAIRQTIARVLTGPAFLYRTEKSLAPQQAPVNAYELASRLSYFLWSSLPDDALRQAAAKGTLLTQEGMRTQTKRMLRDPKSARLAPEFGATWLHVYAFDTLDEKSERHFPSFPALRGAMYEETLRFFTDFFQNGRSILSLLDADHTFVNGPLAKHYEIPVTNENWQRVDGMKAKGRGGLLGHSTVLAKQSGASRTSPILRGNWISEVLLGEKLPRPPKDVPQLPDDEANLGLTMRELVEKHTSDPRCSSCHRRIDPFGYSLERFDAIGRARDRDLGGRPIRTETKVMDGTELDGLDGLRRYLLGPRRDAFVRQFCRKLLGYALGRAVQLSDEPLLDQLLAALPKQGYSVNTAIDLIVSSRQFREIRGHQQQQEEPAP